MPLLSERIGMALALGLGVVFGSIVVDLIALGLAKGFNMRGALLAAGAMGTKFVILAAWISYGRSPVLIRLPAVAAAAAAFCGIVTEFEWRGGAFVAFFATVLLIAALMSTLRIAGYRLISVDDFGEPTHRGELQSRGFSLRSLFVLTTIIAMLAALAKAMVPWMRAEDLIGAGIVGGILGLLGVVTAWAILCPVNVGARFVWPPIVGLIVGIGIYWSASRSQPPSEIIILMVLMPVVIASTAMAAFGIARINGLRLWRPAANRPATSFGIPMESRGEP